MSRTSDSRHGFGREACGDGEEPLWWCRLGVDGVRFRPKALIMGGGTNATVALPDHAVGAKGNDVTVLMHEPDDSTLQAAKLNLKTEPSILHC